MRVWIIILTFVIAVSLAMTVYAAVLTSALIEAAREGDINTAKDLIDSGTSVNLQDSQGKTALHHAAENGHMATVELLLKADANPNALDDTDHAALCYALKNGHEGTAKLLTPVTTVPCPPIQQTEEQPDTDETTQTTGTSYAVDFMMQKADIVAHIKVTGFQEDGPVPAELATMPESEVRGAYGQVMEPIKGGLTRNVKVLIYHNRLRPARTPRVNMIELNKEYVVFLKRSSVCNPDGPAYILIDPWTGAIPYDRYLVEYLLRR